MRAVLEWLKGIGSFVLRNADAFLAMAVAFGVILAEVVGEPSTDVIRLTRKDVSENFL